ncbi:MAG: RNA 2'-phosphotransferase [Crocinitomicaceae bacterium]|nr:RNA 2'-phosphotransferase [Flavobacteriales bacterium]NQZ34151.1 RNA 2'-phosphotransferase [Crocinitomicaceae bacterium]
MNEKELIKKGKFLSLILRHNPEKIKIELDNAGWTDVDTLIRQMNKFNRRIDIKELEYLVENNSKKRYAFNSDKTKIRANQGHSLNVDLGLKTISPPEILYHGTADRFLESIYEKGLIKKERHHVHLSADLDTASNVGKRHGRLVIFEVDSQLMNQDGFEFYKSDNGVWLTDEVPSKYLKKLN